jgi:4-hydroxy-tetrahydrodipicolinate synthase
VVETVLDEVGDSTSVIAGAGTNSHSDTLMLTQECTKAGAHGIMLVTPYYNKPPQDALVEHFRRAADCTHLPVLLYNVPSRTGVNMLPETVERLAEVPNIVALKDASANLEQTTDTLRRVPDDFVLYSGEDSLTLPIVSVGGYGVVSVASHVAARSIKRMIELAVSGQQREAAKAHRDLYPLFKAVFVTTNPVPVKAALELIGIGVGTPRLPLRQASGKEIEWLKEVMTDLGIIP